MMERFEHAELQTITLHNNSVHWYKKEKEIIANSTLFDVHHYFKRNDSTVFTGLFDIDETELKKRVKKLLDEKNENDDSRRFIIAKLICQVWFLHDFNKNFANSNLVSSDKQHTVDRDKLLFHDLAIPFPPPRC